MWVDEASEVFDMFRHGFPLSLLFFVPFCIMLSPASAAHEFSVYRMQQFDLQGVSYGCRNSLVNVEARYIESNTLTRKCILTKLKELTMERFKDVLSQNAAALVILLPADYSTLTGEDRQHLLELEQELVTEDIQVPVFVTPETGDLLDIYRDVKSSGSGDDASSAAAAMLTMASANGFQMVVNGPQSKAMNDFQLVNLQGKLTGYGIEEQLPSIVIAAHYDAFGLAPGLAFGADSNGSGVVALLELARLFSKLYTNSKTHARYNIVFLLSAAGKFNYQGTKRWIEDNLDTSENSLLNDVAYVLCLDSLSSKASDLFLHVSKPPKDGSAGSLFYQGLEEASTMQQTHTNVSQVHKKINLADDFLAWEHERFSIRRLPAFTISTLDSHRHAERQSILDTRDESKSSVLARNIKILAEGLARQLYNISSESRSHIFTEALSVQEELLQSWLSYLTARPRGAQLLHKDSPVVATLEETMSRYLKDTRKILVKAEKRDPEFVFYDGAEFTMAAYSVKPAVFDLFLALGIAAYLGVMYLLSMNFNLIYTQFRKVLGPIKAKKQ